MKLSVAEDYGIVAEEVYNGISFKTAEGNEICVCMRDDTFEINVCPKGKDSGNWKRVNMQTGEIENLREIYNKKEKNGNIKSKE